MYYFHCEVVLLINPIIRFCSFGSRVAGPKMGVSAQVTCSNRRQVDVLVRVEYISDSSSGLGQVRSFRQIDQEQKISPLDSFWDSWSVCLLVSIKRT